MHSSASHDQPPMRLGIPCLRSVAVSIALLSRPAPAQQVDYSKADQIRTYDRVLVGGRVYPVFLSSRQPPYR